MDTTLDGLRVAIVVANEGVEQVELTEPRDALDSAGAEVVLIAPEAGQVQAFDHLDKADVFVADQSCANSVASDFDALVLPGGVANPDHLRMSEPAVSLIGDFVAGGRPVGVICHGAWTLIEADVVRGRTLTSWPSLQTDLINAGATWVDEPVVVCEHGPGPIISSRRPGDLPQFCRAVNRELSVLARSRDRDHEHASTDDPSTDESLDRHPDPGEFPSDPGVQAERQAEGERAEWSHQ